MKAAELFRRFRLESVRASRRALVITLALAITLVPVGADAEGRTRTATKQYITGDGYPWMSLVWCDLGPISIGGVCLGRVTGGEVTITIDDDSGRRVGGYLEITDGNGNTLSLRRFCGSIGPIALEPGFLFVNPDGPKSLGWTPQSCPLTEFGYATKGRVHAVFTE